MVNWKNKLKVPSDVAFAAVLGFGFYGYLIYLMTR